MADSKSSESLVHLILNGMPAWIRAIVFTVMAFPLVVALSGMMLQVNVGSTIERVIDAQFQKQGDDQIEAQRAQLEIMLSPVLEAINKLTSDSDLLTINYTSIEERLTVVEGTVDAVSNRLEETKNWACSHSDIQSLKADRPEFCP